MGEFSHASDRFLKGKQREKIPGPPISRGRQDVPEQALRGSSLARFKTCARQDLRERCRELNELPSRRVPLRRETAASSSATVCYTATADAGASAVESFRGRRLIFGCLSTTPQRGKSSIPAAKLSSLHKMKFSGLATLSVSPGEKYQRTSRDFVCTSHRLRR
jgi:hypothetical protein